MEEKRAKTLEALSTFIDSQKALLERTQADIARLKQLRNSIASTPVELCDYESFKDEFASHRMSDKSDIVLTIPKGIDWSAFAACDPAPFKALEVGTRLERRQRLEPSLKQTSPLSSLQQLVKDARASIIDPVFQEYPPPSDEEEEPLDPEELRRIREREKIRELKRRKVHGSSRFYGLSGLGLRKMDAEAVFVREDQADESADVDIGVGGLDSQTSGTTPSSVQEIKQDADTPATSIASLPSMNDEKPSVTVTGRSARNKRPTRKIEPSSKLPEASTSKQIIEETAPQDEEPKLDKKGKPRPETYKQAWSVEEQHLLERLLDEIPEGSKNRWAQISKAMNGKRTPRQVASRVQKYYEKLKRFGLDVGIGNRTNGT
ncbi:hypothetical protein BDY19DRAFT_1097277 [Irpex rosettiformis]|uniref:Uncharacterized protein n=1 Tax=Irpex rosettiformis TaxID=378272 RepID=A0ACB8TP49_9APHY|nr:hypothetical protein BDY19DRAFT_1097277 [Irpex rosettiformis]